MDHEGLALCKLEKTIWFDGPTLGPSWLESRGGSRSLGNSTGIRCCVPHQAPNGAPQRGYLKLLGWSSVTPLPVHYYAAREKDGQTGVCFLEEVGRAEAEGPKAQFSSCCVPALHLFLSIDF